MPIVRRKKVLFIPPPTMAPPPAPGELNIGVPASNLSAPPTVVGSAAETETVNGDGEGEKKEDQEQQPQALAPTTPVYFLKQTGEIFTTYEAYCARLSFYRQPIFQCEVTGKSGLDFFAALQSERSEARMLEQRFPEQLKVPVLRTVQFQVVGRLDDLVGMVYERFKDRYYVGEKVLVEQDGERFVAHIQQVYPPKKRTTSSSSASGSSTPQIHPQPRSLSAAPLDDPNAYFYSVQIAHQASASGLEKEETPGETPGNGSKESSSSTKPKKSSTANGESTSSRRRSSRVKKEGESEEPSADADAAGGTGEGFKGSLMEVKPDHMSRDRLAFSKSILRRYLAATLERGAAVASPWLVKRTLCKKYGIEETMGEERKEEVELIRKGALGKRKKATVKEETPVVEEDDGRVKKKRRISKKTEEARAEKKAAAEEAKRRKAEDDVRKKAEEEAAKVAAEAAAAAAALAAKKKPVKYPTEDLDVKISDRERKHGKRVRRPEWRKDVFFLEEGGLSMWETFLETWNFLIIFSKPLQLVPFTIDDFHAALRHVLYDPPCVLIGEAHMALLTLLLKDSPDKPQRHRAIVSMGQIDDGQLIDRLSEVGEGWEKGGWEKARGMAWEDAVVGCLKECATVEAIPRLREIFEHLLLDDAPSAVAAARRPVSPSSDDSVDVTSEASIPAHATPRTRYPSLPSADKLAILKFLTELVVVGKTVKTFLEAGDSQLTELRKEKIELNRERKRLLEELTVLDEKLNPDPEPGKEGAQKEEGVDGASADKDGKKSKKANGKSAKGTPAVETPVGSDGEGDKPSSATKGRKVSIKLIKPASSTPAADTPAADSDIDMEGLALESVEPKAKDRGAESDLDMDSEIADLDQGSDVSESGTPGPGGIGDRTTSRQKSLLQLHLQREAEEALAAERRVAARAASASHRALLTERKRIEEEDLRHVKRLEAIEREFRKLLAAQRQKPLGKDRFHNLIWWFDGMGGLNLTGAGGNYLWSTGRLYIQGASEADRRLLDGVEGLEGKIKEEECESGALKPGEWAYYDAVDDVEDFMGWLNLKGRREFHLDKAFQAWSDYIYGCIRRRISDMSALGSRAPDTRRSTRVNTGMAEVLREPYMQYTNRKSHK